MDNRYDVYICRPADGEEVLFVAEVKPELARFYTRQLHTAGVSSAVYRGDRGDAASELPKVATIYHNLPWQAFN